MTRTTREFGISSVAALAIALAALPAGAQTVTPAHPSAASDAVWAQYLSTSAPVTGTAASTEDSGDRTWTRYGIGAAAVGAGGLFSFYLANSHSSDPGPFVGGSAAPVAPESSGPGPVVSETGQAATQGGSSPTASSAGTAAAPSAAPAASGKTPSPAPASAAGSSASSATTAPAASNGAASSTPAPVVSQRTPSSSSAPAASNGVASSTPAPVVSQRTPSSSSAPAASGPRPSSSTPHPGAGAVTAPSTAGPVSAPAAHGASQAVDAPPVIISEAVSSPSADAAAPITVTPEPSTLVLLMSGVLAFLFLDRRRRIA